MELGKKQLHPGAKWSFRIGAYITMLFFGIFISWFIGPIFVLLMSLLISGSPSAGLGILIGVFLFIIFYIILIIIVGEIFSRMSYNRWFYEFTDDNLKIERGIIWKRYSNVPYERVQNVDIHRGIIARIIGFSSVMIQTAGYSATARTEGYIPAVDIKEAEEIREFLMKKIRKKGQGL
jgi:membrane protein YdbS with pleckstrin-like domain